MRHLFRHRSDIANIPKDLYRPDTGRLNQAENWNGKDVLAAIGRGASKQGAVPVSDDRAKFKQYRRRGSESDEDNRRHQDYEGYHRVHCDA